MEIGVRLRIYKIEQFSSALELDLRQFPQIARIIQNIIMSCFNNKNNNNVSPCSAGKKQTIFSSKKIRSRKLRWAKCYNEQNIAHPKC